MKISVLSKKKLFFAVKSINIAVSSFLYRDTCTEKVNITSMAYNRKNIRCEDQEILQTLLGFKEREI